MTSKKAQKPPAKLAESNLSITSAFKKLSEHIRKAGKSEGEIKDESFTGPLKQALRAHRTNATHFESSFVMNLVSILNDGGRSVCSRLDADLFCIVVEVILQSDHCQESERGLFLLADSLRGAPHHTGRRRNQETRKTAIGKRCDIDLILGYFVDASNHPGLRRWVGILCIELVDGSEANVDKLHLCSEETRRSIGALVIEETNEIIRFVCGKLIRVLQRARIGLEYLWPTTADRTYFTEFPAVLTQEDNGWSQQFHSYVDEMISLLADKDKPDITSTIYCAESCSLTPMHCFGGSSSKVVIQLNEETFTILAPPTASSPYQILDVPIEAIDAMILLLDTESQVIGTAEGLVEILESTSPCYLDGEAIILKAILIISDVDNLQAIQTDLNDINSGVKISSEYKEAAQYSQQPTRRASQASYIIDLDELQEESVPDPAESGSIVETPSAEEGDRITQLEEGSFSNENDDIYDASPINKSTHAPLKNLATVLKQSHIDHAEVMPPPRKPLPEEKAGKFPTPGPKPKAKTPIKVSLPSAHRKPRLSITQTSTSRASLKIIKEQPTGGIIETKLPRSSKVTASGSIKDDTLNSEALTNPDYHDVSTPILLDTRATTVEKDGSTINISQSQAKKPTRSEKLKKDLTAAAKAINECSHLKELGQVKVAHLSASDPGDVYDILPDQDYDYEADKKEVSKSTRKTKIKAKAKSHRSSQSVVKKVVAKSKQEVNKRKSAPATFERMPASQRTTRSAAIALCPPKATTKAAADQFVAEPKQIPAGPRKLKAVQKKNGPVDEATSGNSRATKIVDITNFQPKLKAKQPLRLTKKAPSISKDGPHSPQRQIDLAEVKNVANVVDVDTVNVDIGATGVDVKQQTNIRRLLSPPTKGKWQKDTKHTQQEAILVVTRNEMGIDMMEVDDAATQIKPLRGPKDQVLVDVLKEHAGEKSNHMSTTTRPDLASKLDSLFDFSDGEGSGIQSTHTRMQARTNNHPKCQSNNGVDELADVSPIKKSARSKSFMPKTKLKVEKGSQEQVVADNFPTTEHLEVDGEVQNVTFDPPPSLTVPEVIAINSARSTYTVEREQIVSPEDRENPPSSGSRGSVGSRKRRGSIQQAFPLKKRKSEEPQVTASPTSLRLSPRLTEKIAIRMQEDAAARAGVISLPERKSLLPVSRTPLRLSPAHNEVASSGQRLGMMQPPKGPIPLKAKPQTLTTSPRRTYTAARQVVDSDGKQKDYCQNSLVDEHSCRKPVVIGFGRNGPQNQGSLNKLNTSIIQIPAIDSAIGNNQSHRTALKNPATTPRITQVDKKRKRKDGDILDTEESPPKKRKNSSPHPQQPIEGAQGGFDPIINSVHDAIPSSPPVIASVPTIASLRHQKPSSQAPRVDVNGSPLPSASSQKIDHIRRVQQKLDMLVDQPGEAGAQRPTARRRLSDVFGPKVRLGIQTKARPSPPEKSEARYVPHHKTKLGQYEGISTKEVIQPQEYLPDPFVEKSRKSSDFTERLRGSVAHSNCRSRSLADVPEKVKFIHEIRQQSNESVPDLSSGSSAPSGSHDHARTPLKELAPREVWNLALRPHYTGVRETVHRIADEMIIRLSDEEDKMGLLVNQYKENGTKVLDTMTQKRAEEKLSMRRVLQDKKNSIMYTYNEAKKSISRTAEKLKEAPINLFEKEWRNRQSYIRDRIVKAGSNGK
ncbi:hypothetical protein BGZ60DRAFT_434519 [Tricladium varicosporioides]|nr:hypothetical protein BGZ60DRAFT_434519 [Hymenoscyphus varicosporioides]